MDTGFELHDVTVDFNIYGVHSRSLRSELLRMSTGGAIQVGARDAVSIRALSGLSFTITHGERVGLIGHNGAGKTTLLRVLAGVYEPTFGTIKKAGRMSALFDLTQGFDPDANGFENILIRGMYIGLTREELRSRQDEIAKFSGLGGYLHVPVRTYSVGMLMRLAFSISTAISPEILLMDEWLAVGDSHFVPLAEKKLVDMIGTSGILVMASHSMHILQRVCTRLIWLEAGKVVEDGSFDEVSRAFAAQPPA